VTTRATITVRPEPDAADDEHQSVLHPRRSGALEWLASSRVWIASAVLFIPFAFVFFASTAAFAVPEVEAACGQAPPDMRFYSTGDDIVGFLDACGPVGRSAYRNMQLADLVYPAIVGLFLASSLALATRRLSGRNSLRWVAAVPLLATLFDYLENAFAWLAITAHPGTIATNDVLGLASAAKTSLSWAAGLTLLGCLAALAIGAARGRVRHRPERPNMPAPSSSPHSASR
jgi:hypothetical protein